MKNLTITLALVFLSILILQCQSTNSDTFSTSGTSAYDVTIDPGHGGQDPGGIASTDSIMEKDVVLLFCKIIKSKLGEKGIKTRLLRTDDRFVSLKDRMEVVGSSNAEINISVHLNSSKDKSKTGYLTLYQENNRKSETLDRLIHEELNRLNIFNDNGSQADPFYMLSESPIPSVIIDLGYISNAEDLQRIMDESNQNKLSESIAKAIKRYQVI